MNIQPCLESVAAGGDHSYTADTGYGGGETHSGHAELPLSHVLHVSLGLQVDFVVESDHDEDGEPEGETGGHDGVGVVHYEPALIRVTALVNNSVKHKQKVKKLSFSCCSDQPISMFTLYLR